MVIHIKLSDRKTADTDDPLGRSWYGYDPGATAAELWENNRGDWRLLAERIAAERWAALNYQGRVVLVAELEEPAYEILPGTTPPKKALFGRVLPAGHPVREALMRTQVVYSSRNAIQYDPALDVAEPIEADSSVVLDTETEDRPGAAGQGLQMDAEVRKAIEDAAQDRLMSYFRDRSWAVTDTRQNRPYDAVADKGTERIYLEAKGTQSRGDSVIVTRNEVNHARQHPGACVMGVWSDMKLVDGVVDRGSGKFSVLPFSPDDQDLRPRDFDWRLPRDPA
ncbi:protein NO VEIN domain-containing protein [Arthrobacter sp. TE12232]